MRKLDIAALLGALAFVGAVHAAPTTVRFGDSAAAVDLTGNFVYAVTANRDAAGLKVGDATFSWMRNTSGFVPGNANTYQYARDTQSYYDKPQLNEVMRYWAYSDGSKHFMPDFMNLIPGHTYKWQVLINTTRANAPGTTCISRERPLENLCHEQSELIYIDYFDAETYKSSGRYQRAIDFLYDSDREEVNALLISDAFTASGSTYSLDVASVGTFSRVNALTLEDITPTSGALPEPATLGLVGIGFMGAVMSRRRKAAASA